MSESQEFLFDKKYLASRCHRDQKVYRNRRKVHDGSIVFKRVNDADSCRDYTTFDLQKNKLDRGYLEKNIEDPFGIDHANVAYSKNKKKRWNIHKILYENIEYYQNHDVNLRISTVKTNQVNYHIDYMKPVIMKSNEVSEFAGYSQRTEKIVQKKSKNMKLHNFLEKENPPKKIRKKLEKSETVMICTDRHKDIEEHEHDLHMIYVTEEKKMSINQYNSWGYKYEYERKNEKTPKKFQKATKNIKKNFDFGDVFHHQTSINMSMEDEEIVESKSSYFLEDFIVDKSKKSRIKKDEIVEIETPKIDEEIMAEKLRIFNKQEEQNKIAEKEKNIRLQNKKNIEFLSSEEIRIYDKIYPEIGLISNENNEIIGCRKVDDNLWIRCNIEQPSTSKSNSVKKPNKIHLIYSQIIAGSLFHKSSSVNSLEKLATTGSTSSSSVKTSISKNHDMFTCKVCYIDDSKSRSGFALSECMHYFCLQCWKENFNHCVKYGPFPAKCMENGCSNVVTSEILAYFFDIKLVNTYSKMLKNKYLLRRDVIECDHCHSILLLEDFDFLSSTEKLVLCNCGQIYCSGCKQKAHFPLTCAEKRLISENNTPEFFYISNDEAQCPGCGILVEKINGCNHMSCRCGHDFCYTCGQTYNSMHVCRGKRRPNYLIAVKGFDMRPNAFIQVIKWELKRDASNISSLKEVYKMKRSHESAEFMASQYVQICELIENVYLKSQIQAYKKESSRRVHRRCYDEMSKLNMLLEKLANPKNSNKEILERILENLKHMITMINRD